MYEEVLAALCLLVTKTAARRMQTLNTLTRQDSSLCIHNWNVYKMLTCK